MSNKIKILLDPGHFHGVNKMSNGYAEGTQMWRMYTFLRPMLEAYGFTVGTTRTSSYDYPKTSSGADNIVGRGNMAKGYDIMLSLHTNACNTESVNRPVVIYPISGKRKDLADKLGAALQSCMGLQKYQNYSKKNSAGTADYYGVIRGAAQVGVPCLIIEHTFHTNNAMAKWLLSDTNLKKVAKCVADTVAAYYGMSASTTTSNSNADIDALVKKGVIDSPDYWYKAQDDLKNLPKLLEKLADACGTKDVATVKTAEAAIQRLVDCDVIDSPDYWKQNYSKVKYLDQLLIKAAKRIEEERLEPAQGFNKSKAGAYTVKSSDGLNLRLGPTTDDKIIESMYDGETVRCYGYFTGNWLLVVSASGKTGYCHSGYLVRK